MSDQGRVTVGATRSVTKPARFVSSPSGLSLQGALCLLEVVLADLAGRQPTAQDVHGVNFPPRTNA